ncbi:MAG: hypothetical protein UZ22_OP11002000335 [Microgenomates bacterium OLB23]|nr:MAG: hypothetical protein UZ22_OP11002000335 [Microgenomates bacterium OLB23]
MHYRLNAARMGEISEKKYSLSSNNDLDAGFDEYYKSLKKFHKTLIAERDRSDRYNRVGGRNKRKESLAKRYAHMLAIDQGGINQALGGSYFDFSLEIQQGGVDAVNRLSSDVTKSKKMTEAWAELTGDGGALEKFAMAGAADEDEIKHGAEHIAEAIEKVAEVPHSFSPEMGHEYKLRHEIFGRGCLLSPMYLEAGWAPITNLTGSWQAVVKPLFFLNIIKEYLVEEG